MKRQLADFTLYKLRYILGYGLLGLLFVLAVTIASIYTPGGLTENEIANIEITNGIAAGKLSVTNLPFHLTQLTSFMMFGVSILSIKLAAIICSVVAAVAIFFLLRRWFKQNIAILTMLIMTTTGQFIYIAQNATPLITYIMFTALILLFASLILQEKRSALIWKIGLALSVGLSWYTPYFIYITICLLIVALIHPHTRHHLLKKSQSFNWLVAFTVFIASIMPLIYLYSTDTALLTSLLGLNQIADINFLSNAKILFLTYFWIEPVVVNGQILPILDFSSLALIILGFLVLFRQSYTSRSYMIIAWLLLSLPITIIQPGLSPIITIPLFILLAVGIETLLSEWYQLFPRNPYARGAGLILTVGLITVMIFSGVDRFVHGYRYTPQAANSYSTDLKIVKDQLAKRPVRTLLVVSHDELPLYEALAKHNKYQLTVTVNPTGTDIGNALVTASAKKQIPSEGWTMQRIFTNDRMNNSARLYLYKVTQDKV